MSKQVATTNVSGSFRETMRGVIAERLEVFLAAEAAYRTRGEGDADIVHDVRVASRRLRAALDASGETYSGSWFKPLRKAVKRVAGELGAVRDADVQLDLLEEQRGQAAERELPGIDRLDMRLRREREVASARARATLDEPRVRKAIEKAARRFEVELASGETS